MGRDSLLNIIRGLFRQTSILILIIWPYITYSQNYKINYDLRFSFDTLLIDNKSKANIAVFVNPDTFSLSGQENIFKIDSVMNLLYSGKISKDDYFINRDNFKYNRKIGFIYKKNYLTNITNIYENVYTSYFTYSQNLNLDWKLIEGEKIISTYNCKKAVVSYKGRNYIAWYTDSIAIQEGPLMFSGLPGLILEIYDEKNHYHFIFNGIQEIGDYIPKISHHEKKAISSTREKVFELREAYRKDISSYVKTLHNITLQEQDVIFFKEKSKHRNNPLELE